MFDYELYYTYAFVKFLIRIINNTCVYYSNIYYYNKIILMAVYIWNYTEKKKLNIKNLLAAFSGFPGHDDFASMVFMKKPFYFSFFNHNVFIEFVVFNTYFFLLCSLSLFELLDSFIFNIRTRKMTNYCIIRKIIMSLCKQNLTEQTAEKYWNSNIVFIYEILNLRLR